MSAQTEVSPLLIDSNLLLILLVGSVDRDQVGRAKRTKSYTVEDFDLLSGIANRHRSIAATPNVLTEVSDLATSLNEPLRKRVLESLAGHAQSFVEHYFESAALTRDRLFLRLGLADLSVVEAARLRLRVLTDDLNLYLALEKLRLDVINFAHVRSGAWELFS